MAKFFLFTSAVLRTFGYVTALVIFTPALVLAQGARLGLVPPAEPPVKPIVSAPLDVDVNRSRIDDRFEATLVVARHTLSKPWVSLLDAQDAQATLDEAVEVEAVFSEQITQAEIDAFLNAGGTIDHIFSHVSYGWTGRIPLKNIEALPDTLGPSLLGLVGSHEAHLTLDEATRNGRVRSTVWNLGYDGDSAGSDRITIAIIDSGVDGTHADLSGRQEYWKDWTADNHATAQDYGHHGSHVTGIALGSGASSGISPSTLSFMDLGNMPTTSNSFFPGSFHVPLSLASFNWTTTMRWRTSAGVSAQIGHANADTSGAWGLISTSTSGSTSPLVETNNGIGNPDPGWSNRYSPYASKVSGGGGPEYAAANTISYTGLGDGYNLLRGVAPDCTWAGFKVFQDNGSGTSTDIGEALDDLVAQRTGHLIKVANMSLGFNGNPGINLTSRNKTNTAAQNGIVMVVSAGNDGRSSSGAAGEIDDPGRAHYAITVAASADDNQLTDYSSHGFNSPGDLNAGDEDRKPDITAPGGSNFESLIFSLDSNTSDSWTNTGAQFSDSVLNNYLNISGTSMASPFIAGCAALIIDALQQNGEVWDYTGANALGDVLKVKQILLMTATETNLAREAGPSGSPALNRGDKDINEGYGLVNADAAIEIASGQFYTGGSAVESFGAGVHDRRCWARIVNIAAGQTLNLNLDVPGTGDFDMYLYFGLPDTYGNPVILTSSVSAGAGVAESLSHTPGAGILACIVIKRVSGSGSFVLTSNLGGPTSTPTRTPTNTPPPASTATRTATPSPSHTPIPPTSTPTRTPTASATLVPTSTPTFTQLPTSTPTATPAETATPSATATPAPTVVVQLNPVNVTLHHPPASAINPSATAAIDLNIAEAVNLGSFAFALTYDASAVIIAQSSDVSIGPFLGSTGNVPSPVGPAIDNTLGTLHYGATTSPSGPGPNGSGNLARIVWSTKFVAQKTISPLTLVDAEVAQATVPPVTHTAQLNNSAIIVCFYADIDCDDDVDVVDVQFVAGRWNSVVGSPNYDRAADIDGDGDIDIVDIQLVSGRWNTFAPFSP